MKIIPCAICGNPQIAMWHIAGRFLCEVCFYPFRSRYRGSDSNETFIISPCKNENGMWISDPKITFRFLRKFIEECLYPISDKKNYLLISDPKCILKLVELLDSKKHATVDEIYAQCCILKSKIPLFDYEHDALEKALLECQFDLSKTKKQKMKEKLTKKIKKLTMRITERRNQLNEKRSYILATYPYYNSEYCRILKLENKLNSRRYKSISEMQLNLIKRFRKECLEKQNGVIDSKVKVNRINWKILEPSGNSLEQIVRHYEKVQSISKKQYDMGRIYKLYELLPQEINIEQDSFNGYIVFVFQQYNCAIFDCPEVGNALYLMNKDRWKSLSQISKTELMDRHKDEVERVIHTPDWYRQLKIKLNNRRIKELEEKISKIAK